ncbi:MAG: TonB-dependent receptor SusC [Flavobacteriaceae bacterium]|nr:MAG: TonB-dependent receptor SusC [Flavobacteriaceae bacterium]
MKKIKTKLFLFTISIMCASTLFAQTSVSGTVVDEDGQPIPGVTILDSSNDQNGTVSDFDGNFTISVPSDGTLKISYIGYQAQSIAVSGQTNLSISLEESVSALDEVVITGYGSQVKKSDLTGSISSIGSEDFENQPLIRVDQALQARAAGVAVTQTSGAPGAGYKIRIRGANSITGNNNPLYVVDGLVVGNINNINASDISSMEVLKDASATAIYGNRGANGVVLITTKSGKKGKAKIQIDSFFGTSEVVQKIPVMTPAQFAEGVNLRDGVQTISQARITELSAGGGADWQEYFFRTAPFSNVVVSASGGSDDVDYYISANSYKAEATVINQDYSRLNLRANINAQLNDKLKIGINNFVSRSENNGARANLATGIAWDMNTPPRDSNGDYNSAPLVSGVGNGSPMPLLAPENNKVENISDQLISSIYANYNITDNITLNISAGIEKIDLTNSRYTSSEVNGVSEAVVRDQQGFRFQNTNRLTYKNDNPDHAFQADLVHEQQSFEMNFREATASSFFSNSTNFRELSLAGIQNTDSGNTNEKLESFLARLNYSLYDKYLFTASVRADGSSKFNKDNQWGTFPSGSIAWRISQEDFLKDNPTISSLKARASFGVTGSQAVSPFSSISIPGISTANNYPFTGGVASIGVAPSTRMANPDLTWETTTQFNIGFDLGLWSSKALLSVDYYTKKTEDILLSRILPEFVGPTLITQNAGEVENKGFDISLNTVLYEKNDLSVNSIFNLSSNKNKVVSLVDGIDNMVLGNTYYGNTFPVNPTRVEVGKPISTFRGYHFEGVYQTGATDGTPGHAKYRDLDGDSNITTNDIGNVGDGNPDFTWGWNLNIDYKDLNLNMVFEGAQGNDIYNFQRMRMLGLGSAQFHAVHADFNNSWTTTNPSNTIHSGTQASRDANQWLSSQFLEDGSYTTLRSASLTYNIKDALSVLGVEQLKVFVNAENLFIITDYSGFDPVSTASGNSDVDLGIDLNAFPISRSFSVGLNLTF